MHLQPEAFETMAVRRPGFVRAWLGGQGDALGAVHHDLAAAMTRQMTINPRQPEQLEQQCQKWLPELRELQRLDRAMDFARRRWRNMQRWNEHGRERWAEAGKTKTPRGSYNTSSSSGTLVVVERGCSCKSCVTSRGRAGGGDT